MQNTPPKRVTSGGLLSTGAAARMVGVHPTTIWRAIDRGELRAMRLGRGGDFRITEDALDEWLQPTTGGDPR
jgi:excisionase family DNA binding protein